MNITDFIARFTIEMLKIGFEASMGLNKNMVCFENKRGNKSYLNNIEDDVELSVYKVTAFAFPKIIFSKNFSEADINFGINKIKDKLGIK